MSNTNEIYNLIPDTDYVNTCAKIKERNGETAKYKSGDLVGAIDRIPGPKEEIVYQNSFYENREVYEKAPLGKAYSGVHIRIDVKDLPAPFELENNTEETFEIIYIGDSGLTHLLVKGTSGPSAPIYFTAKTNSAITFNIVNPSSPNLVPRIIPRSPGIEILNIKGLRNVCVTTSPYRNSIDISTETV